MNRLTPELWLHSAFQGDTDLIETRVLDFNLARRSAVVINNITGQLSQGPDTTTGFESLARLVQEVDVDPDNVDVEFGGDTLADDVVIDSSRVFRQYIKFVYDTAAGATLSFNQILQRDWTSVPWNERPISITNLRHHISTVGVISNSYHGEIAISYFIVELSLAEIGILNASRR